MSAGTKTVPVSSDDSSKHKSKFRERVKRRLEEYKEVKKVEYPHSGYVKALAEMERKFTRMGCDNDTFSMILERFHNELKDKNKVIEKLETVCNYVGPPGEYYTVDYQKEYFQVMSKSGEVGALTNERFLKFFKNADYHENQYEYRRVILKALSKGKAQIKMITKEDTVNLMELLKSKNSTEYIEYIHSLADPKSAGILTNNKVIQTTIQLLKETNSIDAGDFLRAVSKTGLVNELTDDKNLDKFKALCDTKHVEGIVGTLSDYFRTVSKVAKPELMVDKSVLDFLVMLSKVDNRSNNLTKSYLAIASSSDKALEIMTNKNVMLQAENLIERKGAHIAFAYMSAVGKLKDPDKLTQDIIDHFDEFSINILDNIKDDDSIKILNSQKVRKCVSDLAISEFSGRGFRHYEKTQTYLIALLKTNDEEGLTSKRFIDFACSLPVDVGTSFLNAIAQTGKVKEFLESDLTDFMKKNKDNNYVVCSLFTHVKSEEDMQLFLNTSVFAAAPIMNSEGGASGLGAFLYAIKNTRNYETFTSQKFIDLIKELGPGISNNLFVEISSNTENSIKSVELLCNLNENSKGALAKVADRVPELFLYHNRLLKNGYNAEDEVNFLAKKGDKAEITRVALNIKRSDMSNLSGALGYIAALKGMESFTVKDRVLALDKLATFSIVSKGYDYKITKVARENIGKVLSEDSGYMHIKLQKELRGTYPDVINYLDRHSGSEVIDRSEALRLLLFCYKSGKNINIKQINAEKSRLEGAVKRDIEIKPSFERKFMEELRANKERAKYQRLLKSMNIFNGMLSSICDKKINEEDEQIPQQVKNVLLGYMIVSHNKDILKDFIKKYYSDGREAAERFVDELPENKKVIKEMTKRGTNVENLLKFKVTYSGVGNQNYEEKLELRNAQLYSETLSLLHELGYKDLKALGLEEKGDRLETAEMIYKKLAEKSNAGQIAMEKKPIVDDIKMHLEGLKSSFGQLHAAKENSTVTFSVISDPLIAMQLGVGFPSCLDITKGSNNYGAVARAIDKNNVTIYASSDEKAERVIGRISLIETNKGFMLNSHFYENTTLDLFNPDAGWIDMLIKFSKAVDREVVIVPTLFSKVGSNIVDSLAKRGFKEEGVSVHIDRAVCSNVYSDLGFSGAVPNEGIDRNIDAFIYRP